MHRSGARTLGRGLTVLRAIGEAGAGATVAEIASVTALDRAVLYRLLETLAEDGFVVRDRRTRRYHLGVALIELGAHANRSLQILQVAQPAMRALTEQTRQVVCLAVRDRGDVVIVDRVDPPGVVAGVRYQIGDRHPLSVGAHGRAVLAQLGAAEQAALASGDAGLAERLQVCHARGFAVASGELQPGTSGVAAAVLDGLGEPVASVGVVAPSPRLPDPASLGPPVVALAEGVSNRLRTAGLS